MASSCAAVVGASPRNFWTNCALKNLQSFDPQLKVVPVTPNHESVAGLPTVASVPDLPQTPRVAVVAIRREASVEVVRELVGLGTPDIVLVSDGFGERGDDIGRRLQAELVEIVSGSGTRLWGPNCVGFADFAEGVCAIAEPAWLETVPGPVSIVSQSGALLSVIVAALREEGLGADFCVSTGNGALLGVAEAIDVALDRPTTRVVGVYLEGVGADRVDAFVDVLAKARRLGKQVLVLKSGVSERGARAVLSHTASIAGTDTVFGEFLREHGAVRADSVDELCRLATLALLGVKKGRPGTLSVLGASGGAAALCSDLAEKTGTSLTVFADATVERISELAGPGSFIDNPIDVIGVTRAYGDESVNGTIFADPNTGLVLLPWSVQFPADTPQESIHTRNWDDLADLSLRHEMPLVIASVAAVPVTDWVAAYRERNPHVAVVQGLASTFSALSTLIPSQPAPPGRRTAPQAETDVLSEADSRTVLAEADVDMVRGVLAPDAGSAAAAATGLTPPFAVKVVAPISHKSRIGGVTLGVSDVDDLAPTIERMRVRLLAAGLAEQAIEGYLIEEMVFGSEILIGLETDPVFGKYVVVGLGGTATEIANRSATRRLPLGDDAAALLAGVGIHDHQDAEALLERLCAGFEHGSLAPYRTVEINPLIVNGDGCWAADAVVGRTPQESAR